MTMMKRVLTLLLALCLLLPASLAEGAEERLVYTGDFTGAAEEWHARGTAELTVTEGTLLVSGRAKKGDGPAMSLSLNPGLEYSFTMEVMQDAKASIDFTMAIERKKSGVSSYTKFDKVKAPKGEWVTISGEWTAEAYDSYELYVSTVGTQVTDFRVRNVRITATDPNYLSPSDWQGDLPSLKELSAGLFDYGTCVSGMDVRTARRTALVTRQYNIVTPENELKPDAVLDVTTSKRLAKEDDTAVAVHFSSALPILNYARDNGLKVHGHVLVWHSQTPEEFFHVGYDRKAPYVTREVMLARLENYIRLVLTWTEEHYPGLIVSWDVANECVADGSTSLRASNWTKVVGQDFVARAFEYADKYAAEGVLLYYNDYSIPYEPKTTGIMNLLSSLVAEGHIDGVGFQSHYSSDAPSIAAVRSAFDRAIAMGLRLRVSELDLTVTADNDRTRAAQARQFGALTALYVEYADHLEAVQVWGVSDGTSWIKEKHPLFFDADLQPKPGFFSVAEALGWQQE